METCLEEIKKSMLHAREVNDGLAEMYRDRGVTAPNGIVLKWDENFVWVDDGKGEIGLDIADQSNRTILSTKIVKKEKK